MPPDPVRRGWNAPRAGGAMADRGRPACPPQLVGGDLHPRLQAVRTERLPAVDQPAPASPRLRSPYARLADPAAAARSGIAGRSEEHTSELQSLMRISYAVFCLKKKNTTTK